MAKLFTPGPDKKHLLEITSPVTTILSKESNFKGELKTSGSVRIDGSFEGRIEAQSEVIVGDGCLVKADINAKRVIVEGEVRGNIEASHGLEICSTGKVFGNITGDRLIIEEGAVYQGQVKTDVTTSKEYDQANDLDP